MTTSSTLFGLRALAVLLMASTLLLPAHAMTIRELRALQVSDARHGESFVLYYLVGVMEGVVEAHAQDVRQGAPARICLEGRRLEPRMALGLYQGELRRNADVYEADMSAQLVVAKALAAAYPC